MKKLLIFVFSLVSFISASTFADKVPASGNKLPGCPPNTTSVDKNGFCQPSNTAVIKTGQQGGGQAQPAQSGIVKSKSNITNN